MEDVLKDTSLSILKDDGDGYGYESEYNDENIYDDRENRDLNNLSRYDSYSSPKRSENFNGIYISLFFPPSLFLKIIFSLFLMLMFLFFCFLN